jgi:hypothetical protein
MKVELPSEILKDRISSRFTFVGEDAFKLLKEYLSLRTSIKDDDLILQPEVKARMKKPYLSPETFSNKFSDLVLELGLVEHTENRENEVADRVATILNRFDDLRQRFRKRREERRLKRKEFVSGFFEGVRKSRSGERESEESLKEENEQLKAKLRKEEEENRLSHIAIEI